MVGAWNIILPMVGAWSFADVADCRAVSNPARIFREISCFSPLNIGTLFR